MWFLAKSKIKHFGTCDKISSFPVNACKTNGKQAFLAAQVLANGAQKCLKFVTITSISSICSSRGKSNA